MSAGRAGWACVSALVPSTWPVLFLNTMLCVASALCVMVRSKTLLWFGAIGIGFGVSSSFPAAITLPAEEGIVLTPKMMTCIQLFASAGEMLCPFLFGIAFQFKYFFLFGGLIFCWQVAVFIMLLVAWMHLTHRLAAIADLICRR
uniref:Uncharacterized protein n=1 Tax=Haptolina ericina TaxID=156174 RepID=A0A7S3AQU9_9EUKA|mmetsp:Transcript_30866/g.69707  ORF Transcript_30866/g.69707 Transcript_30866/m.69707 type:complete len:145 (+) Transcript_30866:1-435(+)